MNEAKRLSQVPPFRLNRTSWAWRGSQFCEALEKRCVKYAIRIPTKDSLERDMAELLTRPVGRPSHKPALWRKSFLYRAASWTKGRRVVGKAEQWVREAEQAVKKRRLSLGALGAPFRPNEVRPWLSVVAYNAKDRGDGGGSGKWLEIMQFPIFPYP